MRRLAANDEHNPLRPMLASRAAVDEGAQGEPGRARREAEAKLDEVLAKTAELTGLDQGREALEEAEEAGTRKGRSFEDRVDAAIERIADSRGDCAQRTSVTSPAPAIKKGDTLVEIGAAEGSSPAGSSSRRRTASSPDRGLGRDGGRDGGANRRLRGPRRRRRGGDPVGRRRRAPRVPGQQADHRRRPRRARRPVLELAYRYASLRVRAARTEESDVDATAVLNAAAEARDAIAGFKAVRTAMTQAVNKVRPPRRASMRSSAR